MINNTDYRLGSIVELIKLHPSKTLHWKVVRLGADIKIQSLIDQDVYIMMERKRFNRKVKKIIEF